MSYVTKFALEININNTLKLTDFDFNHTNFFDMHRSISSHLPSKNDDPFALTLPTLHAQTSAF